MSRINLEDTKLYDPMVCMGLKIRSLVQTIAAAFTIDRDMPTLISLDATATARDVTLPTAEEGLTFLINNMSTGEAALTIKNPATTTIGDLLQGEMGIAFVSGGVWYHRLIGAST